MLRAVVASGGMWWQCLYALDVLLRVLGLIGDSLDVAVFLLIFYGSLFRSPVVIVSSLASFACC